MFSAPREPPRKATGFQRWGDRDETTEHFFPQEKSGGVEFLVSDIFINTYIFSSFMRPSARTVGAVVIRLMQEQGAFPISRDTDEIRKSRRRSFRCGGDDSALKFEFYYDGKNLAIFPEYPASDFLNPIRNSRDGLVKAIQAELSLAQVSVVMPGEAAPEYASKYFG